VYLGKNNYRVMHWKEAGITWWRLTSDLVVDTGQKPGKEANVM
jgi:hypothetical protein